jgi:preprotein translocase subunit SecD
MRRWPFAVILPAALLLIATGCSSSSTHDGGLSRRKAKLEFRAVRYGVSGEPLIIDARRGSTTAGGGRSCAELVKAFAKRPASPSQEAVLFDRMRNTCYVLGPTLLTGDHVDEALALFNDPMSQWVVDVHFSTNEFVTRVAEPNLNRIVAIVLDGVVLSAPEVHPGITGRAVQIAGGFDRSGAIAIAASIRGIPPSLVRAPAGDS